MSWCHLPGELRLAILEHVQYPRRASKLPPSTRCLHPSKNRNKAQAGPSTFKKYMLVCKEWQCFFEREAWREIIVHGFNGLVHLESIAVDHRASFIEKVIFTMELPSCTCPTCESRSGQLAAESEELLDQALGRLLSTLSTINEATKTRTTDMRPQENKIRLDVDLHACSDWSCPSEMAPIHSKRTNSNGSKGQRWMQPWRVDTSNEQLMKPELELPIVGSLFVRYPAKALLPVHQVIERTKKKLPGLQQVCITKADN